MFADRHAPLNRSPAHFRQISSSASKPRRTPRAIVSRPVFKRSQRDLQPGSFLEDDVLARNAHIGEPNDAIVKRAQSHEPAAIRDFQSRRVHIDDERCDLLAFLPPTIFDGVRAITTSTPAFTPLVHQSFSPFRMNSEPSSRWLGVRLIVAGSDPAWISVSANAEISPPATRGRYFCFCSSVPNKINGCATPID